MGHNRILFLITSAIVLISTMWINYESKLFFLPFYILSYSLMLGLNYRYLLTDVKDRYKNELNFEDIAYVLSPILSGWFVNFLISIDFLTISYLHLVMLITYFVSTFVFILLVYAIFSLFNLTDSNELFSTSNKQSSTKVDPREFMNETQLQAELNALLNADTEESYIEARKVQDILNKKFSNN